ncbi:hypothetical protein FA95DRAFT_1259358 [Auriscalpium vulgare]|uniref:Uncharacterized protein n=1 Tax=Auriscalpium vulgare TaxID=40419 RepID=A0ACB8S8L2_9AGAM|nr:hypothetical protein FA95DRAFT_1259358 [Auriscalpium vulgare]
MSFNQAADDPGSLPPTIALHYSQFVTPAITFMMIGATMGAVLVSILLALLFFSTSSMARKPIFILNVLAVFLGIAGAILSIYEEIRTLKYPSIPLSSHAIIAMGAVNGITPTLVDSILLLRMHAVFPLQKRRGVLYAVIMGIPVILKIGRLINAVIFMDNYARNIHTLLAAQTGPAGGSILETSHLPSVKIEWSCQLFDDVYSSGIFIVQMYRQGALQNHIHCSRTRQIKSLFWICTSTFVFPVVLGVIQLCVYITSPKNYLLALYVQEVNFHFTIIGVVFATVWAAEGRWAAARQLDDASALVVGGPRQFAASTLQSRSTVLRIEIPKVDQTQEGDKQAPFASDLLSSVISHIHAEPFRIEGTEKAVV